MRPPGGGHGALRWPNGRPCGSGGLCGPALAFALGAGGPVPRLQERGESGELGLSVGASGTGHTWLGEGCRGHFPCPAPNPRQGTFLSAVSVTLSLPEEGLPLPQECPWRSLADVPRGTVPALRWTSPAPWGTHAHRGRLVEKQATSQPGCSQDSTGTRAREGLVRSLGEAQCPGGQGQRPWKPP